jgi:hypothetical protein
MEADWSVEIGEDLPSITVPWSADGLAFIDLRHPLRESPAASVPEAQHYPALGRALAHLNSAHSQVYTSKCDVWTLTAADLDPLEMESNSANCISGIACYIDLVRSDEAAFAPFALQEAWLKRTTQNLRATPAAHARADLVLRSASIANTGSDPRDGFAVTLYVTGCGSDPATAQAAWQQALDVATLVVATSE